MNRIVSLTAVGGLWVLANVIERDEPRISWMAGILQGYFIPWVPLLKVIAAVWIFGGVPLLSSAQSYASAKEGTTHEGQNRWPARDFVPVKVVDEAGHPVQGARITPWFLGIWEATMTWSDEAYGPKPTVQTNGEGVAFVPYPIEVSKGNKTSKVGFEVDQPQFCLYSAACFVRTNEFVKRGEPFVTLAPGTRLRISGYMHGTGKPASGMTADIATRTWKEVEPGVLITSRFPPGRVRLRLMLSSRGSPASFSDVVDLDLKAGEFRQLSVELKRGVRLEGKLDPAVPRPVHNGWASIAIVAKSAYDVSTKLDEQERLSILSKKTVDELVAEQLENLKLKSLQDPWTWNASIQIQRDGSFVFPSLPEGEAGMVAGCDGYVSTDPMSAHQETPWAREHYVHRNAQHVALIDSVAKFTVPLEKTGTAEFKVIDPA